MPNIIFPIFTNGTYTDDAYFALFDKCHNLIPVMSIEGDKEETEERRGKGVYEKLISNMDALREGDILADDHAGCCVLYEKRSAVEAILSGEGK